MSKLFYDCFSSVLSSDWHLGPQSWLFVSVRQSLTFISIAVSVSRLHLLRGAEAFLHITPQSLLTPLFNSIGPYVVAKVTDSICSNPICMSQFVLEYTVLITVAPWSMVWGQGLWFLQLCYSFSSQFWLFRVVCVSNIKVICSRSEKKNALGILIGTALNLYVAFNGHFNNISSSDLFVSSFISFYHCLTFFWIYTSSILP